MTTLAGTDDRDAHDAAVPPIVDIVVPVFNEAHVLAASVRQLRAYLGDGFPVSWRITIVDNASTDGTWLEASKLASFYDDVDALHFDEKGRGRALRAAWSHSDATVVAYTDVDLSTDLRALVPMVAALVSGLSDVAIGSRLSPGARVRRGPKREFVSRTYNRLLHVVFHSRFRDAQCGFKAVRADVARRLLPEIADDGWFFDTELLLLAERNGLRIAETPVDWTDDPDSRVHVARTAIDDLKGMVRVARAFWHGRGYVDLDGLRRAPVPVGTGAEPARDGRRLCAASHCPAGTFQCSRACGSCNSSCWTASCSHGMPTHAMRERVWKLLSPRDRRARPPFTAAMRAT
jgi:glycosyltransferase involved in cell wall biosynthesis